MPKRSDKLKRVRSLAESEEKQQCRAMGDAQRRLDEHEDRLSELRQYREEYTQRQPQETRGGGISSVHYADYQNFLQRLDDAVHAQSLEVRTTQQNRDAHRERWIAKVQRKETLQRAVERSELDETQKMKRLEQKQQDELPPQKSPFHDGD